MSKESVRTIMAATDRVGIVGGWLCDRIYYIFLALQQTIEKTRENKDSKARSLGSTSPSTPVSEGLFATICIFPHHHFNNLKSSATHQVDSTEMKEEKWNALTNSMAMHFVECGFVWPSKALLSYFEQHTQSIRQGISWRVCQ